MSRSLQLLALRATGFAAGALVACLVLPARPARSVAPPAASALEAAAGLGLRGHPTFVENRGAWPTGVRFAALGGAQVGFVEDAAFVLRAEGPGGGVALRFAVEWPAAGAQAVPAGEPAARVLRLGRDGRPATGRCTTRARLCGVRAGIDLELRAEPDPAGTRAGLAYDVHVAAGADLAALELRVDGAERLELLADGALRCHARLPDGTPVHLDQRPPRSWVATAHGDMPVTVGFELRGPQGFGFAAREVLPPGPLVVDPGFEWATFLGGALSDSAAAVAVAADGDLLIGGWAGSSDFPTTPGAWRSQGGRDAFIARLRPDGRSLRFCTYIGGSDVDEVTDLALAPDGSVWAVGTTSSEDFPVTADAVQPAFGGRSALLGLGDSFLVRLSGDGSALRYSSYVGGGNDDTLRAIHVDPGDGTLTIAGFTGSLDIVSTPGAYQRIFASSPIVVPDGWVARLRPDGSDYIWATYFGGVALDYVTDVDVAADGSVVIGGWTASVDFPATPGALQPRVNGLWDGFVARLSADGARLVAATPLGGEGYEAVLGLAIDPRSGDVVVTGRTAEDNTLGTIPNPDTTFPLTAGGYQLDGGGDQEDAFVARLSADLTTLRAATLLGGTEDDLGEAVAILPNGDVVVVGQTEGYGFPGDPGAPVGGPGGGVLDAFVARFDASLGLPQQVWVAGGTQRDQLYGVAVVDGGAGIVAVGRSSSADYPWSTGVVQGALGGDTDVLAMRCDLREATAPTIVVTPRRPTTAAPRAFSPGAQLDALALRVRNASDTPATLAQLTAAVAGTLPAAEAVAELVLVGDLDGDGAASAAEPVLARSAPPAAADDGAPVALVLDDRPLGARASIDLVVALRTHGDVADGVELAAALVDPAFLLARSAVDGRRLRVVLDGGPAASALFLRGARRGFVADDDGDGRATVLDVRKLSARLGATAIAERDADADGVVSAGDSLAALDVALGRAPVARVTRATAVGGVVAVAGYDLPAELTAALAGRALVPLWRGPRTAAFALPFDLPVGAPVLTLRATTSAPRRDLGAVDLR
ncbi:MAG: hypothetical protein IPM29_21925 [Planctomycetes bacterium]|nr:hypothetical protein [Planctomycetota bacterium]